MVAKLTVTALVAALTAVAFTAAEVASPSVSPAAAAPVAGGLGFTALATPCRVVDTRSGGGALAVGATRSFQVGGPGSLAAQGGSPAGCGVPDGAGAVEVAVTTVAPSGNGFLRAFPAGYPVPNATFINYTNAVGVTNTGTVPLAAAGVQDLSIANFGGSTQVVVDVLGYFTTGGTGGYTSLASPCRAVDTRAGGGLLAAGASRSFQVAGTGAGFAAQGGTAGGCGVPDGVPAAVVSITAVGPARSGFLRGGPNTGTPPSATVVNYTNAVGITNTGALPLGNVEATDLVLLNFVGTTHVVVDVLGYYAPSTGSRYQTVTPCRAVDTRFAPGGKIAAGTTRLFQTAGSRTNFISQGTAAVTGCGVPDRAAAVAAAVTAVAPDGNGFTRAYPAGGTANGTFLNFTAGRSITNSGVLALANGGLKDLAVKNFGAAAHYVVDILGYYEPPNANPDPAADISVGYENSCAVGSSGLVLCWGQSDLTKSVADDPPFALTPTQVPGVSRAISVATGSSHACALLQAGTVKCWGSNLGGQLGDGTTVNGFGPAEVVGLAGVVGISAGDTHTCALIEDRSVKCWGSNFYGQLGDGTTTTRTIPTEVSGLRSAASVQAGGTHTCALSISGRVSCWGGNGSGQAGGSPGVAVIPTPTVNYRVSGAVGISAGGSHSCATLTDGSARCWGSFSYGQLGTDFFDPSGPVVGLDDATSINVGGDSSCATLSDGTARCWGENSFGQLGLGGYVGNQFEPQQVIDLAGVVQIDVGGADYFYSRLTYLVGGGHACAILRSGTVSCWGSNLSGKLGDGTTTGRPSPVSVSWNRPFEPLAVSAGVFHSCAVLGSGSVLCWGSNSFGQLGDGTTTTRRIPTTVPGAEGAVSVAAGESHSCALMPDGSVSCWGGNSFGQLGDGTTNNRTGPVDVVGVNDAHAIFAGLNHTCALERGGVVVCWGHNNNGQLGRGGYSSSSYAQYVDLGAAAVSLSLGDQHSCASLNDGSVSCWGWNLYGQLGNGTTSDAPVPSSVVGLEDVSAVEAGGRHTCAVLGSGSIFCWGLNQSGQLGDGTTSQRLSPAQTVGVSDTRQLALGTDHSCALRAIGSLICWGQNDSGQVGDGTSQSTSTPSAVAASNSFQRISAGYKHTCAKEISGTLRCWGLNSSGQIGDGSNVNRLSPVSAIFPR